MGHLYKYSLKKLIRQKDGMFWGLAFPLIMATLFYVTFGSGVSMEKMKSVPAALVMKEKNTTFENFMDQMDQGMLQVTEMDEEAAVEALKNGQIKGIFYSGKSPSLTVAGSNMAETILKSLLDGYLQNYAMMEGIAKENPLAVIGAARALADQKEMVENISVKGRTMDDNLAYFYALISMACLFGCFMGLTCAMELRADQSALAARRSITPVNRFSLIISEMLAAFTVQFFNLCVLLLYMSAVLKLSFGPKWPFLLPVCALGSICGVAFGMFIGTLRLKEGPKIGILVSLSLLMSFLSGLMYGKMKDIVEHNAPVLNRINPAALIADAFYSVSVYDNPARYRMNLIMLAAMTAALVLLSFMMLRRERYESL